MEWFTFLLFVSTFLFMALYNYHYFFQLKKPLFNTAGLTLIGVQFLFFFGAMEEVSWFQRIADIQSSDFFLKHNAQAETNLHNLTINGVKINKLIFGKILFLVILSHNLFVPLIARKKKWLAEWIDKNGFFLPPLSRTFFYIAAAIAIELFIDHDRAKEHLEIVGAIHYFIVIYAAYGLGYLKKVALFPKAPALFSHGFLIAFILLLSLVSWILGNLSLKDFML